LHKMGVPPHLKGFAYLRDAVILYLREGYYAGGLTKEMYPALAEKYKTTMSGVEAGIRNALAAAWKHGNTEFIRKLCEPYCEDSHAYELPDHSQDRRRQPGSMNWPQLESILWGVEDVFSIL